MSLKETLIDGFESLNEKTSGSGTASLTVIALGVLLSVGVIFCKKPEDNTCEEVLRSVIPTVSANMTGTETALGAITGVPVDAELVCINNFHATGCYFPFTIKPNDANPGVTKAYFLADERGFSSPLKDATGHTVVDLHFCDSSNDMVPSCDPPVTDGLKYRIAGETYLPGEYACNLGDSRYKWTPSDSPVVDAWQCAMPKEPWISFPGVQL